MATDGTYLERSCILSESRASRRGEMSLFFSLNNVDKLTPNQLITAWLFNVDVDASSALLDHQVAVRLVITSNT